MWGYNSQKMQNHEIWSFKIIVKTDEEKLTEKVSTNLFHTASKNYTNNDTIVTENEYKPEKWKRLD